MNKVKTFGAKVAKDLKPSKRNDGNNFRNGSAAKVQVIPVKEAKGIDFFSDIKKAEKRPEHRYDKYMDK